MVGFHRDFDYERMRIATTAVHGGARLVGTNDDATYPTPDGPIPGGGAILAAVPTAVGRPPVVAGKPYAADGRRRAQRCSATSTPTRLLMVGDRASTDGAFAVTLGCPFALVRSGVTPPGEPSSVPVAIDVPTWPRVVDVDSRACATRPDSMRPMAKNTLQKLLESGVQFSEMTRKQAEAAVKKLVKAGEVRRSETEATVQTLIERGKATAAIRRDRAGTRSPSSSAGWPAASTTSRTSSRRS